MVNHSLISITPAGNLWDIRFLGNPTPDDFKLLVAAMKAVGADFDGHRRCWVVAEVRRADLLALANATAKDAAGFLAKVQEQRLVLAGAKPMATDDPAKLAPATDANGNPLSLMPHQVEGVRWVAGRQGSLLAFDMGTGKTSTAIACFNACPDFDSALVICPASLKRNWYAEIKRWLIDQSRTVGIAQGSYFPPTDIVIMNYDILTRHKPALDSTNWDFVIVDECHMIRSPKAQRTKAIIGGPRPRGKAGVPLKPLHAHRRICLTGTPVVNTPADLWPVANWLDPKSWPNLYWFEQRYCQFETKYFGRGKARVYTGAKNLDELNARLKGTIMLRKTKAQVLPDLPPKFRQVIEVDCLEAAPLVKEEQALVGAMSKRIGELRAAITMARVNGNDEEYRQAVEALADYYKGPEGEHVAIVRQRIAMAKLPYVIDDIRNTLLDPTRKVLVGGHHRAILEAVVKALSDAKIGCVLLYGGMTDDAKDQAVRSFQGDPNCRVFVGGFRAAGVGLNLTAADEVVFVEEDYVPSTMSQFEDRAHRKGQTKSVLVKHIVAHGSLDSRIAKLAIAKQEVADRSVDGTVAAEAPVDWLGDHRTAPTDEELSVPISGNSVAASTYGLRRLVNNPREYGVTDSDLILAERLSNRELTGRPAALAQWLMKKYLEKPAHGVEPVTDDTGKES